MDGLNFTQWDGVFRPVEQREMLGGARIYLKVDSPIVAIVVRRHNITIRDAVTRKDNHKIVYSLNVSRIMGNSVITPFLICLE